MMDVSCRLSTAAIVARAGGAEPAPGPEAHRPGLRVARVARPAALPVLAERPAGLLRRLPPERPGGRQQPAVIAPARAGEPEVRRPGGRARQAPAPRSSAVRIAATAAPIPAGSASRLPPSR